MTGNNLDRVNSLRPSDVYICIGNLTIIGSDNGLSPGRRQAIIWTSAGMFLIEPLGTTCRNDMVQYNMIFDRAMLSLEAEL